jgi:sulfite exporter TauE/SafE
VGCVRAGLLHSFFTSAIHIQVFDVSLRPEVVGQSPAKKAWSQLEASKVRRRTQLHANSPRMVYLGLKHGLVICGVVFCIVVTANVKMAITRIGVSILALGASCQLDYEEFTMLHSHWTGGACWLTAHVGVGDESGGGQGPG